MTVCASSEDPKIDGEPSIGFGSLAMSVTFASSASDQVATMPKRTAKQAGTRRQCIGKCAAVVACNLESDNPDVESNE